MRTDESADSAHLPRARAKVQLHEGHVHDLNDPGKEAVMADVRAWIDARLPPA